MLGGGAAAAESRGQGAAGGGTPVGKGCRPARVPVQGWAAGPERGGGDSRFADITAGAGAAGGQQPRRHGRCAARAPETAAPRYRHLR